MSVHAVKRDSLKMFQRYGPAMRGRSVIRYQAEAAVSRRPRTVLCGHAALKQGAD